MAKPKRVATLVLFFGLIAVLMASSLIVRLKMAKPDDSLYNLRVFLTFDPQQRLQLQKELSAKRAAEVKAVDPSNPAKQQKAEEAYQSAQQEVDKTQQSITNSNTGNSSSSSSSNPAASAPPATANKNTAAPLNPLPVSPSLSPVPLPVPPTKLPGNPFPGLPF